MPLPELHNDRIIKRLAVQPVGEHQWATLGPGDPDQFNLYVRGPLRVAAAQPRAGHP